MRLLVVEDDPVIAGQLSVGMKAHGHSAALANCAEDAVRIAWKQRFDAIVLDRMLPGVSGIEAIGRLKRSPGAPGVLMLSALASVTDRIEGLRAGADDYLVKPFDLAELLARLEAILRREAPSGDDANLRVNALTLDPARHHAMLHGRAVSLNRKEFSLLAQLMRHADGLVTRSMLFEQVWGYRFEPSTNIVESNLSRLRQKLSTLGGDPIETIRGGGYILRSDRCA